MPIWQTNKNKHRNIIPLALTKAGGIYILNNKKDTSTEVPQKMVGATGFAQHKFPDDKKSGRLDLNQRPHGPEPCALPTALRPVNCRLFIA